MSAFTTEELQLMLLNQTGFSGDATKAICAKIKAELKERENA